jgi:hypothetical protein
VRLLASLKVDKQSDGFIAGAPTRRLLKRKRQGSHHRKDVRDEEMLLIDCGLASFVEEATNGSPEGLHYLGSHFSHCFDEGS